MRVIIVIFLLAAFMAQGQENSFLDNISPSNKLFIRSDCKDCSSGTIDNKKALEQAEDLTKKHYAAYNVAKFSTASKKTIGRITNPMRYVHLIPTGGSVLQSFIDPILDQALEKKDRDNLQQNRKALNKGLEDVFSNYVKNLELDGSNNIDFAAGIKEYLETNDIEPDDYGVYGKKIDEVVLEYMTTNEKRMNSIEEEARLEIKLLRENNTADVLELKRQLKQDLVTTSTDLKKSLDQVNILSLKGLEKYNELSNSLQIFENKVYEKFDRMALDMEEMQTEINANTVKIEENQRFIENNKNQISEVKIRLQQNRDLTTQNAYKIDVMLGVQYENSNISGKLKLLEIVKFSDDPIINQKFIEKESSRLSNIQTVKNIEHKLQIGAELVTLAGNLGLPEKDLKNVNKALQIGSVIANGVMAYYTGNPLQGLQAVNGAFALFGGGGGSPSDPRFEKILKELGEISKQIKVLDKKIDELDRKIVKLYELNVKLHQETISRFNQLDYKLDNLNNQIGYVIKILTAECAALSFDMEDNQTLLRNVDKAKSLEVLNIQHITYPILSDLLNCINDNVKIGDVNSRTFIHFNRIDENNTWESQILKPMIELATLYANSPKREAVFNIALKASNIYTNDFSNLLAESRKISTTSKFLVDTELKDLNILLHPESIIQLSSLLNRFEPYFYFGDVGKSFEIYPLERLKQLGNSGFFEGRSETLRGWYKTLLRDTEIALAQQNLLAGSPILPIIYSELSDFGSITPRTEQIFRLLNSENFYLKTNYATYAIFNEIGANTELLELLSNSFYKEESTVEENLKTINKSFNGDVYKLIAIENNGLYVPMLKVKTPSMEGAGNFTNQLILPIQTIDVIIENKMIYPKIIDDLIYAHDFISSKIIEHDMMVKAENENFKEFKKLLNNE